ncbi:MAG TPA: fibrinogen-like YCDxxxxGGGW domain-containing protein [Kofleriaceae bacterium]|nr:fibrinogen-like YCDxxxxGGGW domain-containing protein [Kofleriaceae bacterium]
MLPVSCAAILADDAASLSGNYDIDPDGAGGDDPVSVYCDMVAAGGGWTVVFYATGSLNALDIGYIASTTQALLDDATEALIVYRTSSEIALAGATTLALPNDWKAAAPFTYAGNDVATDVSVNGAAAVAATVRYGRRNFASLCTDAWTVDDTPANQYGRICVTGTAAPFYSGFARNTADQCTDSSMAYNAAACTNDTRFSIAVR